MQIIQIIQIMQIIQIIQIIRIIQIVQIIQIICPRCESFEVKLFFQPLFSKLDGRRYCPLLPPSSLCSFLVVTLGNRPGSFAFRQGGGRVSDCPFLVSFEDAFSLYSPRTGKRVPAAASGEPDEYEQLPNTRLNDGRYLWQ